MDLHFVEEQNGLMQNVLLAWHVSVGAVLCQVCFIDGELG
jgi:hypothetical protein